MDDTLSKFTKGRDNLDMYLSIQTCTYNKAGLGYESKNINKSFNNICLTKKKIDHTIYKCKYYGGKWSYFLF